MKNTKTSKTVASKVRKSVKSVKQSKKLAPKSKKAVVKKVAKKKAAKKQTKVEKLVKTMKKFTTSQESDVIMAIDQVIEGAKAARQAVKDGRNNRAWSLLDGVIAHADTALVRIEVKDDDKTAHEQDVRTDIFGLNEGTHAVPETVVNE
jgi:hypothetical protein